MNRSPQARAPTWPLALLVGGAFSFALFLVWTGLVGTPTPLLSEDWTHWSAARALPTFAQAVDLAREPVRPLQHAFFWCLAHAGLDPASPTSAWVVRVPAFVLHCASIVLVYALARALGLPRQAAAGAALLFALFPTVKSVAWPAAIGTPGRAVFELAALVFLVQHERAPRAWRGAAALACSALALGFHESAVLLPALALCSTVATAPSVRDACLRVFQRLREPWFGACALLAVVFVVQLAVLHPARTHGSVDPLALPSNVAKASLSLWPEDLRVAAIQGLRTPDERFRFVVALFAVASSALLWLALVRSTPLWRCVAFAVALELALPIATTGFVQRYAYLAAAWFAIGLAGWAVMNPKQMRARLFAVFLVAMSWAIDSLRDALEYADAGHSATSFVAEARALRDEHPSPTMLLVVDPPDMGGTEEDVPLFNWGIALTLDAYGVAGPWEFVRTRSYRTNSDVRLVTADEARALVDAHATRVIEWDAATRTWRRR